MRTILIAVRISAGALLLSTAQATPLAELTSVEADAMILARETEQQAAKAARQAQLNSATVRSEGSGVLPSGQEVIIREVDPPANLAALLSEATAEAEAIEVPALSSDQTSPIEPILPKTQHVIMLSAIVYESSISRLSWKHEAVQYVAYANLDFNDLHSVNTISTEAAHFTFFNSIENATTANPLDSNQVSSDTFSSDRIEYYLTQGDPENTEALACIEALLDHYESNKAQLKIQRQRREALASAQARYDATHPEEPEPFIMQFWVPEPTAGKVSE